MRQLLFFFTIIGFLFIHPALAQTYDQLNELKDHSFKVYYSKNHDARASSISRRMEKAITYYHQLLDFKPAVTLLILSEADWNKFTTFPVYGMPHYKSDKTLVVAAEDNNFWKSFLPPLDHLPVELRKQIQTVYRKNDSTVSMERFFDLLALHELGHAFHLQGGLNMQRKWMGELYVNILLHTYIAEKEPESLPALTLFPKMVVNMGTKEYTYTSLKDIEERYEEIGKNHPKNYGWYQCRWHVAAERIYETSGKEIGRKLWDAFKNKKERLTDAQLLKFLERNGGKAVADMILNWGEKL